MSAASLLLLLLIAFCWALIAKRMSSAPVTGPLIMTAAGYLVSKTGYMDEGSGAATAHALAELTLVIVLFSDAARINLRHLISDFHIPRQMLLVAMPGAIALGTLTGVVLFPEFGFWGAAMLAAILAPTDAALGEAVVSSDEVPQHVRESLSVESGLNDGLAVPVVILFACFSGLVHEIEGSTEWLIFGAKQVAFGILAGVITGYLGARLLKLSIDRSALGDNWQGIAGLVLAGIAWALAECFHGNGFIAAFVGGLVFGDQFRRPAKFLFEFFETEGQILVLGTFGLFGAALLPTALLYLSWPVVLYALLSLTIVRMLPVALSLSGHQLRWSTKFFLGWFGPRGLASILFALMIAQESGIPGIEKVTAVVFITVLFSIVLHGMSAGPLSILYGRRVPATEGESALESQHRSINELNEEKHS